MANIDLFDTLVDAGVDLFLGGAEQKATDTAVGASNASALAELQAGREAQQFYLNTSRPLRYGGGAAYNQYLNSLGLGASQQNFTDEYNFGGAGAGTTFGAPTSGGGILAPQTPTSGGGGAGAAAGLLAVGALRNEGVRNAVGGLLGGETLSDTFPRVAGRLGGSATPEGGGWGFTGLPNNSLETAGNNFSLGNTGEFGAAEAGFAGVGRAGSGTAGLSGPIAGEVPISPATGAPVSAGSNISPIAAGPGAPTSFLGSVGSIGSGAGPFQSAGSLGGNINQFGGAAVGGILAGYTAGGSRAKKIGTGAGAAAGQVVGSYFGPIGGAIGNYLGGKLGGAVGGQVRSRNQRHELLYDNTTGQFVTGDGNLRNEGDIRQQLQNGQLQPNPDYPGYYNLDAGSLDGHQLLVDDEGNVVSGTNGRDLTPAFFNIFTDSGTPQFNGQNVTNTGGGHGGYGQYDPSQSTFGQQQQVGQFQPQFAGSGQIGIPAGEQPGGFLGGTQVIGQPGVAPDAGQAIPGLTSPNQQTGPNSPGTTGNLPTDDPYAGFLRSPGYNWVRDEILNSAQRRNIAGGDIGPRYLEDLQNRAGNLASTEHQNYLANLQNAFAPGTGVIRELGSGGSQLGLQGGQGYAQGLLNSGLLGAEGQLGVNQARRNTITQIGNILV